MLPVSPFYESSPTVGRGGVQTGGAGVRRLPGRALRADFVTPWGETRLTTTCSILRSHFGLPSTACSGPDLGVKAETLHRESGLRLRFAPSGVGLLRRQVLPLPNHARFMVIGTTYGFDSDMFALPIFRGAVSPLHAGQDWSSPGHAG